MQMTATRHTDPTTGDGQQPPALPNEQAQEAVARVRRDMWMARVGAALVLVVAALWLLVSLLANAALEYIAGGLIVILGFAVATALHIRFAASRLRAERATLIELHSIVPRRTHEAPTDEDTGFYRRWFFVQRLEEELARSRRHSYPTSLVVFSVTVDDALNERERGVLTQVSEVIRRNKRASDIASLCGADQFAVCLTQTDQAGAELFARRVAEAAPRAAGLLSTVTVLPQGDLSAEEALRQTERQARRVEPEAA